MTTNLLEQLVSSGYSEEKSKEYLSFINQAIIRGEKSSYVEKHHILPYSIFPKLSNLKKYPENLAKITAYDHFVAHYYLAKLTNHSSMIYALNCMNRTKHKFSEEEYKTAAIMYSEFREQLAKIISQSNTGRIMSSECKKQISERTKNTVVVKDTKGNKFRTSIYDSRYVSGELVFHRADTKHKSSTIEKMKKSRLSIGDPYTNISTGKLKYFKNKPNENWTPGIHFSSEQLEKITNSAIKKQFWTHETTGEQKRFIEYPGEGWVKGRRKFNNKINDLLTVYNIQSKSLYRLPKKNKLKEWEVYKNKHVFLYTVDSKTYVHDDINVISKITNIPIEMVDLWGKKLAMGSHHKKILKRSFSSIKDKQEKEKAMSVYLGIMWGSINLIKKSPLDPDFPLAENLTWISFG